MLKKEIIAHSKMTINAGLDLSYSPYLIYSDLFHLFVGLISGLSSIDSLHTDANQQNLVFDTKLQIDTYI